jgi:hypothetical protein
MSAAASTIAPARPLSMPTRRIVDRRDDSEDAASKQRGTPQCMEALARANKVRLARAALKRDIGAGRRNITEVILENPWEVESMGLGELLCAQRRWGRARSRKLLSSTSLGEGKRVGTLTERQRRVLVAALEAKLASRLH